MTEPCTIRDVAKKAGVSVATVSRVLSDSTYPVSQQVQQRVREVARELGYVPNAVAKSLRKAQVKEVGVVIPSVSNPFYMHCVQGIHEVLTKNGYTMILCNTMNDPQRERQCLQQLAQRQIGGVILSSASDDPGAAQELARRGIRFVTLDQRIDSLECSSINFDSRSGGRLATEHLLDNGHRKIAFASLPLTRWTRTQQLQGYRDALQARGIAFSPDWIYTCDEVEGSFEMDRESYAGRQIACRLIEQKLPVSAVVCVNDMLAIGLMHELLRQGVRIPQDISVVGFDDIPFSQLFVPALTTVRCPAAETGRLAAIMLLDVPDNTQIQSPLALNLTPQLIQRDTVAKIL